MKYILIFLFIVSYNGSCQIAVNDLKISENNVNWFDSAIGEERTGLAVGIGEQIKVVSKGSSPYFNNGKWSEGNVSYRGEVFKNAQLIFDLINNQLISKNSTTFYPFKLNKSQVDWFIIKDILFERHHVPKIEGENEKFLEVVFTGDKKSLFLYSYRQIRIKDEKNEYYDKREIWMKDHNHNIYHKIKNKRDIKRIFPDQKKQLNSFFRDKGILFIKKASKNQLKNLARFCNQL